MNTSDKWLDEMRGVCDPVVDDLVTRHAATLGAMDSGRLLGELFRQSRMPDDHPLVAAYMHTLRTMPRVDLGDPAAIARGQALFALFGPEILLILGSYALPLAFAAGNGVQVIYRARRLKDDPVRRLCDTAQMVLNVMQPGQLDETGIGWYSTRKVRLIHALVRHHVQESGVASPETRWQADWGKPINQEDLAGTLMTFSIGVIHGLRLMGAHVPPDDADAFVAVWAAVGRLLGLHESLLPATEGDATTLATAIGTRQLRATDEGKQLNAQLMDAVDTLFPFKGYALSLTHFFLRETVFGVDVGRLLDLPRPNWTAHLVNMRAAQKKFVLTLLDKVPGARRRRSFVARHFTQAMILLKRPDRNAPFEVPPGLVSSWGLRGLR